MKHGKSQNKVSEFRCHQKYNLSSARRAAGKPGRDFQENGKKEKMIEGKKLDLFRDGKLHGPNHIGIVKFLTGAFKKET